MDLKAHYANLYEKSIALIETDQYQIDNLIHSPTDFRRGLTLVIKPDEQIGKQFQSLLTELKEIDPHQYYYPVDDFHITALSIITCYEGFKLADIVLNDYIETIQKSLANISPFSTNFEGITASPSCIMACGYFEGQQLPRLRDQLRTAFNATQLQKTIDHRYTIQTAHVTAVRLQEKIKNRNAFVAKIKENRHQQFGKFTVKSLDLVYNDWYQKAEHVRLLHRFDL